MKSTLITLLVISLVTVSCQKELSWDKQKEAPVQNVWAALEAKQPAPQKFTVSATTQTRFSGTKGTQVLLPGNAFVTASGAPVTGNVAIEFKEIYDVWEMVLNNKFTQVGTTPIESGGEFFIRAMQNGEELKLAPGKVLQAKLPTTSLKPGMQVFTGSRFDSAGQSIFSWQLAANPTTNNVVFSTDSVGMQNYLMQFGLLGWINCDRFLNEPLHEVKLKIGNAVSGEKIGAMVHFNGLKSVVQLWGDGTGFSGKLPERGVTFIALANRGEQTYAAFLPAQVQAGQQYTVNLEPMTDEEFGQRLRELN